MELLVIGVDGMEPSLYKQWREDLPNLRSLEQEGGFTPLESTYIPLSAPAWASFMTGRHPGHHGIIDFVQFTEDKNLEPLNGNDIRGAKLHECLAEKYTVGVLNLPFTYPPPAWTEGFVVSSMAAPGTDAAFAQPEAVAEQLRDMEYRIEWTDIFAEGKEERSIQDIHDIIDKRSEAMHTLLTDSLDVYFAMFTITDRVQHWFWKHMDKTHAMHEPRHEEYEDVIKDVYTRIDEEIGKLMEEADPRNVVVLSDHGFGPIEYGLNMNQWLLEHDYLKIKRSPFSLFRYAGFKAGFTLSNAYKIVEFLGLTPLLKKSSDEQRGTLLNLFLGFQDIDWERTQAFSMGNFGPVYFNDERWNNVVSTDAEKKQLYKELKHELHQLTHNGEQVVAEVEKGSDMLGDGEAVPDVVFRTQDMRYMASRYFEFGTDTVISDRPPRGLNGHHRPFGVLFAAGEDIDTVPRMRITDVAPTLLHLLDVDVPADMDGRIQEQFLEKPVPQQDQPGAEFIDVDV